MNNFLNKHLLINIFIIVILSFSNKVSSFYINIYKIQRTCLYEQFIVETIGIVRFKPYKFLNNPDPSIDFLNIEIMNYDQTKTYESLYSKKTESKIFFVVPETNTYTICIRALSHKNIYERSNNGKERLKYQISIESNESLSTFSYDEAGSSEEMRLINDNIKRIFLTMSSIESLSELEIEKEEEFSTFQNENNFYILVITIIQIMIILLIFIYTYCSLKSKINEQMSVFKVKN